MPQVFHPAANTIAKASILGGVIGLLAFGWAWSAWDRSPWATEQAVTIEQPVPFSHEHHVRGLGLDCRYCHTSVEDSSFAGLPPTKTCMTCHSQIWTNAPILQPVRTSWETNRPIQWQRVNKIPGFAYFNHSIHIAKGVGCETCHGKVQDMPITFQAGSLLMEWCLRCHRDTDRFLRPRDQVFNMDYDLPHDQAFQGKTYHLPEDQYQLGQVLHDEYHVLSVQQMTNCSECHR